MQELLDTYLEQLEYLAGEIQESEELAQYLEEEDEEMYNSLKDLFEPRIAQLYEKVALENPLQLIALERVLLDPNFEGLFLPRVLGYSVLRGEINEEYQYVRPQDHFRDVLEAICQSANFEIIKKRTGQTVQIGFALSSDIWITNFINSFENKKIRYFLQSQKLDRYRRQADREEGYLRYKKQFLHDNYQTAEFPQNLTELPILFNPLKHFLFHRARLTQADNSSLLPEIHAFLENESFQGKKEYLEMASLVLHFFERDKKTGSVVNQLRKNQDDFSQLWLSFLLEMEQNGLIILPEIDLSVSALLDHKIKDDLSDYYKVLDIVHKNGIKDPAAAEAVRVFYSRYEGLSINNTCIRQVVYRYFVRSMSELTPTAYSEFFELTRTFAEYMHIFSNQQFNQDLKVLSMAFIADCLAIYQDKRGRDYQDIKKFVSTTFLDFGFLKEKEVQELFKSKRLRKKGA